MVISDLHYDKRVLRGVDVSRAWEWLLSIVYIYGNHDNMDVLLKFRNIGTALPILMEDDRVYELGGLRVAGVSGLVSEAKSTRKGVPRKTPEEFLNAARKLVGSRVDILLIHEIPSPPEVFPFISETPASRVALEAVRLVKPRIVVNEHMHYEGYKMHRLPWGTLYIHIDFSQQSKHYLLLHHKVESIEIEVWSNLKAQSKIRVIREASY